MSDKDILVDSIKEFLSTEMEENMLEEIMRSFNLTNSSQAKNFFHQALSLVEDGPIREILVTLSYSNENVMEVIQDYTDNNMDKEARCLRVLFDFSKN